MQRDKNWISFEYNKKILIAGGNKKTIYEFDYNEFAGLKGLVAQKDCTTQE